MIIAKEILELFLQNFLAIDNVETRTVYERNATAGKVVGHICGAVFNRHLVDAVNHCVVGSKFNEAIGCASAAELHLCQIDGFVVCLERNGELAALLGKRRSRKTGKRKSRRGKKRKRKKGRRGKNSQGKG